MRKTIWEEREIEHKVCWTLSNDGEDGVAYRVILSAEFGDVHDIFHISTRIISLGEIQL